MVLKVELSSEARMWVQIDNNIIRLTIPPGDQLYDVHMYLINCIIYHPYKIIINIHRLIKIVGSIRIMAGNCLHGGGSYSKDNTRLHSYFTSKLYRINKHDNAYMHHIPHQPILCAIYANDINCDNMSTGIVQPWFDNEYRHVQQYYTYTSISELISSLHGLVGKQREFVFNNWLESHDLFTDMTLSESDMKRKVYKLTINFISA